MNRLLGLLILLSIAPLLASRKKRAVETVEPNIYPSASLNLATETVPLSRKGRNARSINHNFNNPIKTHALIAKPSFAPVAEPESVLTLTIMRKLLKLNIVVFVTLVVYNISHEYGNPRNYPTHAIIALIEGLLNMWYKPLLISRGLVPLLVDVYIRLECFFLQCALAYSGALSAFPPDLLTILFISCLDAFIACALFCIQ